ncbi:uncharacterized protein LOC110020625 [Phalaenopsis equestris]|uniref:uncharacterized protein LOC110020625 n=1 Tax=Phalaenopsis equestris TaxID=78828 RepID=UPI0009E50BF4|nr:uncharacterized protein LOC110020625 [Phalaenopsis equestris]
MVPPPPLPPKLSMVSSSPGRAEKLPTPGFARLLRGKSGSRSRGQTSLSRSSPLFPSLNRNLGRAAPSMDTGNDGEPSSPKVTCIGQVRIRKKNKTPIRSNSKRNRTPSDQKKREEREMRCCFINKSLFFSVFRCRQLIWRRWSARLRFKWNAGYRRGNEKVEPAETVPLPVNDLGEIIFRTSEQDDDEEAEECDESETRVFVPPKNALILMRCRSAPHNRSSALATRFFTAVDAEDSGNKDDETVKGTEVDEKHEEEEEEKIGCPSSRPLFLKRCKSEPAKKAAKLAAPEGACCSQNSDDGSRPSAESPSELH